MICFPRHGLDSAAVLPLKPPQTRVRISLCARARDVPLDRLRRRVFRGGAAWRGCRRGGQRVLVDEYEWEEHSAADGGVVYVVGTG